MLCQMSASSHEISSHACVRSRTRVLSHSVIFSHVSSAGICMKTQTPDLLIENKIENVQILPDGMLQQLYSDWLQYFRKRFRLREQETVLKSDFISSNQRVQGFIEIEKLNLAALVLRRNITFRPVWKAKVDILEKSSVHILTENMDAHMLCQTYVRMKTFRSAFDRFD